MDFKIKQSVGIVIPTYNETQTIKRLVQELLTYDFVERVVIVDDSPDDKTIRQLDDMQGDMRLSVIHRKNKGGRGSAVVEGIRQLLIKEAPNLIIEMDADYSHQPKEIPGLIQHLQAKKAQMLIASRYMPRSVIKNWPLGRRIFSRLANLLAKALLRIPVSDYTNGFRIYTDKSAKIIVQEPLLGSGFIALSDVLVRIYYRSGLVVEMPTVFINRSRGESSLNMKEISNALTGIFKIYRYAQKLKRATR